jgi:predicted Zn-dependent protease
MPPYSEAAARALLERVLARSKAEGCEALLQASRSGNIRFARNAVSTSGVIEDASLVIRSRYGLRPGTATVNQFDDESLTRTVRLTEELARLAPADPELQPLLEPQQYSRSPGAWVDATAAVSPAFRAEAAAHSIEKARASGCVAAGYLTDSANWRALLNSRNVRALEPGKYTVILEPAASVDLVQQLILDNSARAAEEGRSFLSKPGGTKAGQKMLDERVTIYSDPASADVPCTPWDDEGLARTRTVWIDKGIVRTLGYTRYWAKKRGRTPVAVPGNWVMEGGDQSLEDLIRGTERGVLVTRTWYLRTVDPQTLLYTGLTRDGTFHVERGRIAYAVKNFRFNESPVIMLNNLDALGRPVRVQSAQTQGRVMIPPMRIRDFTFSSLSDAV